MEQIPEEHDISLQLDLEKWHIKTVDFGKHKGSSYETVYQCNPGYCEWILKKTNDTKYEKIIEFRKYIAYCRDIAIPTWDKEGNLRGCNTFKLTDGKNNSCYSIHDNDL